MTPEYRAARSDDASAIAALEAEIFPDAWTKDDVLSVITSPLSISYVVSLGGEILAYVIAKRILDEGEIYRLATKKEYRKNSYAKRLLGYLFENESGLSELYLEVRESNIAARKLYTGCGFTEISLRKNYYRNPTENGVNMHKSFKE